MNCKIGNRTISCLQDNDRRVLIQNADTFLEYSLVFEEAVSVKSRDNSYNTEEIKTDKTIPLYEGFSGK